MSPPFRFLPPVPGQPVVERERLLRVIAERWRVRAVTVVAGPGFGKTTLIASAWMDDLPPGAHQAYVGCRPADADPAHLLAAVAEALGLSGEASQTEIAAHVWAMSPDPVCLVFDDVHDISADSAGAELLADLVAELSENAHFVFASRVPVPIPLARLAVTGRLASLSGDDLLFDERELSTFASARSVRLDVLAETGGWPALAELAAGVHAARTVDYLREEVLDRIGTTRAAVLAALALVGGGDDEIASAFAGTPVTLDDVLAAVPLVARSADGWATVHALWEPALARTLSAAEANRVRRVAAAAHRGRGRVVHAIELLIDAQDWAGVLDAIVEAERRTVLPSGTALDGTNPPVLLHDFARWYGVLPGWARTAPAGHLALGVTLQPTEPLVAAERLHLAAEGFRAGGDADGELAAISREGIIRYWCNDFTGLLTLYQRVVTLAEDGEPRATAVRAVGEAVFAHLSGDSAGVFRALADVTAADEPGWAPSMCWLRSVAHRREGDLEAAARALEGVEPGVAEPQFDITRHRIEWLAGQVDEATAGLVAHHENLARSTDGFLVREAALEAAARCAWIGDAARARQLIEGYPDSSGIPNPLSDVLRAIAEAVLAIGDGDELRAAGEVGRLACDGPMAVGRPEAWFWRDRAAVALTYVLTPAVRPVWDSEELAPVHAVGRTLGQVLVAARNDELGALADLTWPTAGVLRSHLPPLWIAEVIAAASAAGCPAPPELVDELGATLEDAITALARSPRSPFADAAGALAAQLPHGGGHRARVALMGPLRLELDGKESQGDGLRRVRVRELLTYLVIHPKVRREAVAEALFGETNDPGHNLRVTLRYLQQVLEPARAKDRQPYFLRSVGGWLHLVRDGLLEVDVWALVHHVGAADAAERAGDMPKAIRHYESVLPMWRGEPFADVPFASWAIAPRFAAQTAYVRAAVRLGELWLGAGRHADGLHAAAKALDADPTCEPAHRLGASCHLAAGRRASALEALHRAQDALSGLGLEPDQRTLDLRRRISDGSGDADGTG